MRSLQIGSALLLVVLAAIAGATAASATSPPPPSPLVKYSCDYRGPSLIVWRGGYAILTTPGPTDAPIRRTFSLAPAPYRRLEATLAAARFHTLRRVYRDPQAGYERCAVSYAGRTVLVHGHAGRRRLRAVLRALDTIVRANARR